MHRNNSMWAQIKAWMWSTICHSVSLSMAFFAGLNSQDWGVILGLLISVIFGVLGEKNRRENLALSRENTRIWREHMSRSKTLVDMPPDGDDDGDQN